MAHDGGAPPDPGADEVYGVAFHLRERDDLPVTS